MKEGSLKILLSINEVYPLLVADLSRYSLERRGERVRVLAEIGLLVEGRYLAVGAAKWALQPQMVELPSFALVINDAHPALFNALKATPARMRAERLRNLANLGLHVDGGLLRIESSHQSEGAFTSSDVRKQFESTQPAIPETPVSMYRSAIAAHVPGKSESVSKEPVVSNTPEPVNPSASEPPVEKQESDSPAAAAATANPTPSKNKVGKGVRSFARSLGN